jgi:hypothetical protein
VKVNRPKHLILEAVGKFQYLSAFQLARYQFSPTSLTYVQANVAELIAAGYLKKLDLPNIKGRPRAFYALSSKGYSYLEDPSVPTPPRFKDADEPYRNALFLLHTEAANDLVILSHNLPRMDERFTVSRSLSEAQLKKARLSTIPDGWVEIQAVRRAGICFELDRGTVARTDWQAKIAAYSRYLRDGYQQDFETSAYPTIVTVTTTPRRMSDLLSWTTDALRDINDLELVSLLYFAHFNPVEMSPAQAFLAPIWVTPDDPKPQPLLPEDILR